MNVLIEGRITEGNPAFNSEGLASFSFRLRGRQENGSQRLDLPGNSSRQLVIGSEEIKPYLEFPSRDAMKLLISTVRTGRENREQSFLLTKAWQTYLN